MAIIAGVILAVLVIGPFVVAIMPSRQHDPQQGMAVGCLMMFSFAMLVPGGLLAFGVLRRAPDAREGDLLDPGRRRRRTWPSWGRRCRRPPREGAALAARA